MFRAAIIPSPRRGGGLGWGGCFPKSPFSKPGFPVMTPGARIAATIEILEKIERSGSPADDVVSAYMRGRRYIGSKDRRAINERLFNCLRRQARLNWWCDQQSPRFRVLADIVLSENLGVAEIAELFDGQGYGPQALSDEETALVDKLTGNGLESQDMPDWVKAETPEWLWPEITARWSDRSIDEMTRLNQPAPMDLRVNILKADCGRALDILKKDGLQAEPTPYSPIGLRIRERVNLQASTAYRGGFVEVQDEGSQLIALLCDATADQKCIDLCAGGGGKSLALAAQMKDGGPLVVCDTDQARLDRMKSRLKRAGVSNVTRHCLKNDDQAWFDENADTAMRVLADVPCSGSGAWRRNPAAKWRLTPDKLNGLLDVQRGILTQAASLTAPGGRLIYATCSILPRENAEQVNWFLEKNENFSIIPVSDVWRDTVGTDCPVEGDFLEITPAGHGTDGFFAAIMERRS